MSEHRIIFYTVGIAVFFGLYVGYRFYDNRVETEESIPMAKVIQSEDSERIEETNRSFLQRGKGISQLPRDVKKQFPSPNPPTWEYIPQKRDSSRSYAVEFNV